jgi:hypothetical protein
MPRLYVIDRPEPNAFATGRNPEHSAVAVTTGLLDLMDDRQLTGVLAHELSHVKNRDTLVGTIAATIGGAISFIAQMAQFQMIFGGGRGNNNGGGGFGALIAIILAPIAALIIQLAVSRSREYGADSSGAALTADPEGLAQALEKLEAANKQLGFRGRLGQRMPSRGQPARRRRPRPIPRSPVCTSSTRCRVVRLAACSRPTRRSKIGWRVSGVWLFGGGPAPELRRINAESVSPWHAPRADSFQATAVDPATALLRSSRLGEAGKAGASTGANGRMPVSEERSAQRTQRRPDATAVDRRQESVSPWPARHGLTALAGRAMPRRDWARGRCRPGEPAGGDRRRHRSRRRPRSGLRRR